MRLLLALPIEDGYFRPLADQPTMAQALYATVRELRMAGVKFSDIKAEAFESPAKHTEIRALLAAYEQFLVTNNRGDMATVYEEARRAFREVVNDTLRRGLMTDRPGKRSPFRVRTRSLGGLRPGLSLDNISDLLDQVEGPLHR